MTTRISESTIFNNAVRNARINRFELSRLQDQIGSGKRVTSAADDPTSATQILGLRRSVDRIEQYDRNIDSARADLEPIETTLSSMTDVLTRLRELAVASDFEEGQFDFTKQEVEELFDQVLALSNTNVNGRYIFAGFATDSPAFSQVGAFVEGTVNSSVPPEPYGQYDGDNGVLRIQIGEGTTVDASVSGRVIFFGSSDGNDTPDTGKVDIFDVIRDFRNRLEDPDTAGAPAGVLDDLDSALDQVLAVRATVGATLNRLDIAQSQNASINVALETERSGIEDIDIIAAATELQSREATYQASLAVTARVIQPSLLNFLS